MKLVHIKNGKIETIDVPENWESTHRSCSVTGELLPNSEFMDENGKIVRTNNYESYAVWSYQKMVDVKNETIQLINSHEYRRAVELASAENAKEFQSKTALPISAMIETLQEFQKNYPDAKIIFSADGDYSTNFEITKLHGDVFTFAAL